MRLNPSTSSVTRDAVAFELCQDRTPSGIAIESFCPLSEHPGSLHVLALHGAGHTAACYGRFWGPYLAQQGINFHTLNFAGHGHGQMQSAGVLRQARLSTYVDNVRDVIGWLCAQGEVSGSDQIVLLAHSKGGLIGQLYAQQYPVAGLVLVGAIAPQFSLSASSGMVLRALLHHPLATFRFLATSDAARLFTSPRLIRRFLLEPDAEASEVQWLLAHLQSEADHSFRELLHLASAPARPLQTRHLAVLWGEHDACISRPAVQATADYYGVPLRVIPGAPHDVMLARAWRAGADQVLDFLAQREPRLPSSTAEVRAIARAWTAAGARGAQTVSGGAADTSGSLVSPPCRTAPAGGGGAAGRAEIWQA
jgi:pimeloyl-ACP methyl ester carboxylesterase